LNLLYSKNSSTTKQVCAIHWTKLLQANNIITHQAFRQNLSSKRKHFKYKIITVRYTAESNTLSSSIDHSLSKHTKLYRAILWITGTLFSFLTMAVAARELTDTLDPFVIVFLRSTVALAAIMCCVLYHGRKTINTQRIFLHTTRNVIHYAGNLAWIIGVSLIPLAQVFAIEFSIPIWVAILAVLFLGEKMTIGKTVAIVLGFVGVMAILRPGLILLDYGSLAVLAASMSFAIANVCTKALSGTDNPLTILFLMFAMQWPISSIGAYFFWTTPVWSDLPWIIIVGIMALSAHYTMTRALQLADVTIIIPIDFIRMPLIAVIGYFLYAEPLSLWIFIGAILIFSGNYFNIFYERKTTRPKN
jgi:drug/metabolite transporter (DMT)-like permease